MNKLLVQQENLLRQEMTEGSQTQKDIFYIILSVSDLEAERICDTEIEMLVSGREQGLWVSMAEREESSVC